MTRTSRPSPHGRRALVAVCALALLVVPASMAGGTAALVSADTVTVAPSWGWWLSLSRPVPVHPATRFASVAVGFRRRLVG